MPRAWRQPLQLDVAELVLENMAGDWSLWRSLPRRYRARLVATRRITRMKQIAQDYDQAARRVLLNPPR